jgi:RecB family exonuclease
VEALAAAGAGAAAWAPRPVRLSAEQALRVAARAPGALAGRAPGLDEVLALPELASRLASARARGAVEEERRRAVAARRTSPWAGGIEADALPRFEEALPEEWSPSQLEEHARCPFRLLAITGLRLSDPERAELDIDPRDEGSLAHAILERFLRDRLASGALPLRGDEAERERLGRVAAELFARFEADGRTGDPAVWAARREAVLRRLERVVAAEAGRADGTRPALLEHRFGGEAPAPPLVFRDADGEVRLRGRLDRVDASGDRLVLIDYKDSRSSAAYRKKLEPEALGVTNFQLPAYLLAAAQALPGRSHLEASYLLLRSAERVGPFVADAQGPLLRDFGASVLAAVRRIRAGDLPIASRDCAGCTLGAVCRFEARAAEEP